MFKHLLASDAAEGDVVLVDDSNAYQIKNWKKSRRIPDINLLSNTVVDLSCNNMTRNFLSSLTVIEKLYLSNNHIIEIQNNPTNPYNKMNGLKLLNFSYSPVIHIYFHFILHY